MIGFRVMAQETFSEPRFVFNHLFFMVQGEPTPSAEMISSGLKLAHRKAHTGQGSSGKFIFFDENYIELLWVDDPDAARKNLLRLDQRHRWSETRNSPFGIGLTGSLDKKTRELFVKYTPPYAKEQVIWIYQKSLEEKSMPLIFVMEPTERGNFAQFFPKKSDAISIGFSIKSVTLSGPDFGIPEFLRANEILSFVREDKYKLEIVMSGKSFNPFTCGLATFTSAEQT